MESGKEEEEEHVQRNVEENEKRRYIEQNEGKNESKLRSIGSERR